MSLTSYKAEDLFQWVTGPGRDFVLLDVRNEEEFGRFKVEGPHLGRMLNVPYVEFVENEVDSAKKVPGGEKIRIVCAKEGSAKFVGEILAGQGWTDVAYLEGGIKTWGNMLAPKRVAEKNGYRLYQLIRPGKASCSYALMFEGEMFLFDPSRNVEFYLAFAKEHGCRIVKTFETHLQADYISGSQEIARRTGAEIVGHPGDFELAVFAYTPAKEGETYRSSKGGPLVKAVHMPGHTPGSTSFLIDGTYLVSGDAVFVLSIGRPDLGGKALEWSKLLFKTLKTAIAGLGDDIVVLPGHYMGWDEMNAEGIFADTLGSIRRRNAGIYGISDEADFIRFIQDNMRVQPEVYARIRQVNAGRMVVDDEESNIMDLGKNECAASMHAKG
jgi:glyoxylase-like metal-dependent hydrolase (beta-lactamase superfamily II)